MNGTMQKTLLILFIMHMLTSIAQPDTETHVTNQRVAIDVTDEKGIPLGQLQVEIGDHAVKKTKEFVEVFLKRIDILCTECCVRTAVVVITDAI